eukprot:2747890-Pyramimonas_sp.AAC.1
MRQAEVFLPSGLPPARPKCPSVLVCAASGGYAWGAVLSLARPGNVSPPTETLRKQRNRARKLQLP